MSILYYKCFKSFLYSPKFDTRVNEGSEKKHITTDKETDKTSFKYATI